MNKMYMKNIFLIFMEIYMYMSTLRNYVSLFNSDNGHIFLPWNFCSGIATDNPTDRTDEAPDLSAPVVPSSRPAEH